MLRIVEREGQWVEASITNWIEEDEPGIGKRVRVPAPAVTDRATIAAHLAGFGSDNVRELYRAWRSTIAAIDTEEAELEWNWHANKPEVIRLDELKNLLEALRPNELAARQALADAIAEELGHR